VVVITFCTVRLVIANRRGLTGDFDCASPHGWTKKSFLEAW
jgi:hypothetical protein